METILKYNRILLVGCGGGFDIFSGYFLYKSLISAGKKVWLANHSFTDDLHLYWDSTLVPITPKTVRTKKNIDYFPEHTLASFLNTTIYALRLHSPKHLSNAIKTLISEHEIEIVVGVDAGHDIVLTGEETLWGSPVEDTAITLALSFLEIPVLLVCVTASTESMDYSLFLKHFQQYSRLPIWVPKNPDLKGFQILLDSTSKLYRSIPSESLLASLEERYGYPHYINPRLSIRAKIDHFEPEDYPPVTKENSYHYFFRLKNILKTPFYQELARLYQKYPEENFNGILTQVIENFRSN